MVRYKVTSDCAAENERLVKAVYEQLAQERPNGLRYATFKLESGKPDQDGKLDDNQQKQGVTFVHIVSYESADDRGRLTELAAFKGFIAGIEDRYEEPAVTVELSEVGSYAFFAS
jgi:hypothetical protein